jgi:hypothetical protein
MVNPRFANILMCLKKNKCKAWAYCTICESNVYYIDTMSTGMLVRHLRKYHQDDYDEVMELEVQKNQKLSGTKPSEKENQLKMTKFIMYFLTFEKAFINWMIQMYQPISACQNASF